MANLTEQERDDLREIECIGSTESDVSKAITLMFFIYAFAFILFMRG